MQVLEELWRMAHTDEAARKAQLQAFNCTVVGYPAEPTDIIESSHAAAPTPAPLPRPFFHAPVRGGRL